MLIPNFLLPLLFSPLQHRHLQEADCSRLAIISRKEGEIFAQTNGCNLEAREEGEPTDNIVSSISCSQIWWWWFEEGEEIDEAK